MTRHSVDQRDGGFRGRPALDVVELLHPDRDAAEGCVEVGRLGGEPGPLGVEVAERVQLRALDRCERRVELLERRALAAPEGIDERHRIPLPWCVHGRTLGVGAHQTAGCGLG